ncbi:trehalose-6-phosphate synthase [Streptomyces sp. NPDC007205]|uniref:trehalose-6-phosphate synthase n=1 Tax=Streptomyces sp. NPDC007205 TaxID=3154316 RepID=UPI0033E6B75D
MGGKAGSARVLVTDLDGTLLGGEEHDRWRLRSALNRHPDITLVFATGRSLASVQTLLRDDPLVPSPRWIIADVGASVIDAGRMVHLEDLQGQLRAGWPGADRVRAALRHFPHLVYQEGVPQEGRCSFYLNPEGLSDDLKAAVKALGCSWSYASGRYFDVLPARASKGRALRLLGRTLGWPRQATLVAGDSLNDLSLFSQGAFAVVVANAEPALAAGVPASEQVHHSALDGAAAVLEGMERLGWLARRSVVVGYHRPPVRWLDGAWQPPSSPNGILPTLQAALTDERLDAVWAAAHIGVMPPPAEPVTAAGGLPLSLLPLQPERWAGYFHRVCKETLWPALMSQPDLIQDRPAHWADFEEVNAAFARHIGTLAAQGGTVWLHDYNLWLVPALLRAQRPDLAIGLFHHTPFPHPDVFRRIPAAGQLLDSLACLDWAGFHTTDCADHFRRLLVGTAGPTPRVGVHPLGIDRHAVADLARTRLQPRHGNDGTQLVLSVERLDYAKAPVHKIRALDALLAQTPRLRGQVRYRLVCPPPEAGIQAYDSTRSELEDAITRINHRWGTHAWEPVDYIPRNLDFADVVDHYLAADVFWVTSLADGMNLTAQEYITTHHATRRPGVLILSRHAGVAQHLGTAALLTDPLLPHDLVDTLRIALAMTVDERAAHITCLAGLLDTPPPTEWAHTVVTAIRDAGASPHRPRQASALQRVKK